MARHGRNVITEKVIKEVQKYLVHNGPTHYTKIAEELGKTDEDITLGRVNHAGAVLRAQKEIYTARGGVWALFRKTSAKPPAEPKVVTEEKSKRKITIMIESSIDDLKVILDYLK